jgi:hypothetical protein
MKNLITKPLFKNARIGLVVTEKERETIERICEEYEISISELIRQSLDLMIRKLQEKK